MHTSMNKPVHGLVADDAGQQKVQHWTAPNWLLSHPGLQHQWLLNLAGQTPAAW